MPPLTTTDAATTSALVAGRYRVERLLGQGGMGAVYAALDTSTGKRIALKRLLHAAELQSALFEREYHTLASLRHRHIVEVYEYGTDEQGAYYTMELLEGSDIGTLSPLPWREVCAYLRDVASILGVLHARKFLHRDLSPKNLWRLPDGRLKLIDFGSLAPFGSSNEILGTAPFVAPEALQGAPLDQRYDMYALGALGYWLLTGVHAYPAKHLSELSRFWQREPAPPSALLTLVQANRADLPPPALDTLILTLLRTSPDDRPANTVTLIDRLQALADLPPEAGEVAVTGYLQSKAFVGRDRECDRFANHMRGARAGKGSALLVEAIPGMGRSRLLEELGLQSRLSGATTLIAEPSSQRPYATIVQLALQLLTWLPEPALRTALPERDLLGSLSPELRAKLDAQAHETIAGEELRARLQSALRAWFGRLADERLVTLVVDDLHKIDGESQALLAALAHDSKSRKMLIVASVSRDGGALSAAVSSFRSAAAHLHLVPLTTQQVHLLLSSVFGAVPYLSRLAERLHRISSGSPAHCLELAAHLVRNSTLRYRDGAWELPAELSAGQLPKTREEGLAQRLTALTEEQRELARRLSVPHRGELTPAICACVMDEGSRDKSVEAVAALVGEGILQRSGKSFIFAHEVVREQLLSELTSAQRSMSHRRMGEVLLTTLSENDPIELLPVALHLLHAGDAGGLTLLRRAEASYWESNAFSSLQTTAPMFEEALQLLRAQGKDERTLIGPLAMLALAGYFADRRYAARYGDEAVATVARLVRVDLARRLRPWLGGKLALIVSLVVAGISLRLRPETSLSLKHAIRMLLACAVALSGTAAICLDAHAGLRLAAVVSPLAALGEGHIAGFLHAFSCLLATQILDLPARAERDERRLIKALESGQSIRDLPEQARISYLAGLYFAFGVRICWKDSDEALQIADRLEEFGSHYSMSADHLRSVFYGGRGDLKKVELYRQRLEIHAVQRGSAWQVETWSPLDLLLLALRTNDALSAKRAAQEFARLVAELPHLALQERQARAAYLVIRGKFREALPLLDFARGPRSMPLWSTSQGTRARAHNGLGEHERAREVCLATLARLEPGDLAFTIVNLSLQIELALAEAGLGNFERAEQALDRLLQEHEVAESPLTLGALHHARARVALLQRDLPSCRAQLSAMSHQYVPTGIPDLLELVESMRRQLTRAESPQQDDAREIMLISDQDHLLERVRLLMVHSGPLAHDRAQKGLQISMELSGADGGFVLLPARGGVLAHAGGGSPDFDILDWAEQRMLSACAKDETEVLGFVTDDSIRVVGRASYCAAPMIARRGMEELVVGLLVLRFDNDAPSMVGSQVLYALAAHLLEASQDKTSAAITS
jgi:tRNA A-37 threonylcarbamoyl transferase component Bud32